MGQGERKGKPSTLTKSESVWIVSRLHLMSGRRAGFKAYREGIDLHTQAKEGRAETPLGTEAGSEDIIW